MRKTLCFLTIMMVFPFTLQAACSAGDCRNGKGTFIGEDGRRYEGQFKEGFLWGDGKLILPDGSIYTGQFVQGKYHGAGELTSPDGRKYSGQFREGVIDGTGTLSRSDGFRYQGEFTLGRWLDRRRPAGGLPLHRSPSRIARRSVMADLDKDTVDHRPNFDETTEEPTVFPAPYPNLLVNGSTGIAVGMATSIPPHNMREVIEGVLQVIAHRQAPEDERFRVLMQAIPGPDFPSGGTIVGRAGIWLAYREGRGNVVVRGKATVEQNKKGDRESIVITEMPYQVNKATLISGTVAGSPRDKHIS